MRYFILAALGLVLATEVSQAAPRGVRGGFRYGANTYNPVRDLGSDIGAFSGPYRGGYGGRPYYYGYGNYPYGYYGGFSYPVYDSTFYGPSYVPAAPVAEQRSFYPPQEQQPAAAAPAATTATIDLYVPADAEVWLNGQKTNKTGALRRFVTPPLNASVHSTYEVRVRYTGQDGKEVDETREIEVEPGRQVLLNMQPAPKK